MYFRRESKFAYASSFCGINACFIFILSLIIHYIGIIDNNLYLVFIFASLILATLSLILAILTIIDLWRYGYKGGLKAFRAIIYSILVLGPILLGYYELFVKSAINDVSTDVNTPPSFLIQCKYSDDAPKLMPSTAMAVRYDASIEDVIAAVKNLANTENWMIAKELNDIKNNKNYYIEIIHKTLIGGFATNLVIRLHQEDQHSIFVDARARTCNLKSDAGLSESFIKNFMKHLDEIMIIGNIN